MDIDWCLNCNRHIDTADAYCSDECKNWAGPSTSVHPSRKSKICSTQPLAVGETITCHFMTAWADHGRGDISTWASTIPEGPPAGESMEEISSLPALTSRSLYRPPKLLRLQRPVSPSVCMSTVMPTTPPPLQPVSALLQQVSTTYPRSMEGMSSMDQMSSWSSVTESPIATPSTPASRSILDKKDTRDRTAPLQRILEKTSWHMSFFQIPHLQTPYSSALIPHSSSTGYH